MYLDKILWFIAWPGMIAISYFLGLLFLNKLRKQIEKDPVGEDTMP